MTKQEILDSIKTYREVFNSVWGNELLSEEGILQKYFSLEDEKWLKKSDAFEELAPELNHFYEHE